MIDRTKILRPAGNQAAKEEAVVVMKNHHASIAVRSRRSGTLDARARTCPSSPTIVVGLLAAVWLLVFPSTASASLLSAEAEDAVANFLAIFVLFVVPVVLIALFWMVHVLPEKIAHKKHHPQLDAIRTLCFLSLVFGGLLWPLAWLWAYTKPTGYKLAYGTDKHPDYFKEHGLEPPGESEAVTASLRNRLLQLEERGVATDDLKALRADLDALEARVADSEGAR
jgi:Protein of unknown function (DUF3302)